MPAALVDRLRTALGAPHVLTGIELSPYVVDGRTPEAAVFPGSVSEVSAVVRLAAEASVSILPWGGGTASGVGAPPAAPGIVLGLSRMNRLLEHEPGDLTATVEAGMTFAALQAALRAKGQWLSLDPPQPERATVGGVIAADASGPRRQLYGTARDLLIGAAVVTADGAVVHGGGKVVKNVAGYDLPKLFIGSYGTLGVLVELTVKLRPLPDAERLVTLVFDRMKDCGAAVRAVLGSDLIPNALEVLDATSSAAVGLPASPVLVVGFDGLSEQIDWQVRELAALVKPLGGREEGGACAPLDPGLWTRLAGAARQACPVPAAVMRSSVLPSMVADTIEHGAGAARQRGLASAWAAHAGVGLVTGVLSGAQVEPAATVAGVLAEWRAFARAGGGHASLTWAPLAVKAQLPAWDDAGPAGRIMRRIKEQLDPAHVFNPGRFVAGI
ncbi:MAG TPA: FAD-binding oxidoreductase [Candidatus Limnocylindria bacterium]|nr:FAD-binding oxidoreductase [Candidatus Limnocylindria bacterium]